MGMALFWYYLAGVSLGLHILAICVLIPALVVLGVMLIDESVNGNEYGKAVKNAAIALIISASVLVIVPKAKFFYALAGYEASKYIANTEVGQKVQDLIIKKLEDSINGEK